jgi:putative transcriptional regulator
VSKTTISHRTPKVGPRSNTRIAKASRRAGASGIDWRAFDALTDEDVVARAATDPDNRPLTDADIARMRRRPRAYVVRRALRMTQEEFADAYRIPIGTLRDWEQGRTEPDQANRAYLKIIAVAPDFVKRTLAQKPSEQRRERI